MVLICTDWDINTCEGEEWKKLLYSDILYKFTLSEVPSTNNANMMKMAEISTSNN